MLCVRLTFFSAACCRKAIERMVHVEINKSTRGIAHTGSISACLQHLGSMKGAGCEEEGKELERESALLCAFW